ncbi:MAG: YkgJ family cysteine cluster protein [Desulfocapsa sp.]|nr:YkgJ family cysteine cluster protein [Desulfocapsa sp.]
MDKVRLPENVTRIEAGELFSFSCHPDVDCFTDCCRELELALSPYDVLRLKQETGLHSSTFLDRYVIQEQDTEDVFPRFYLTMVDDGKASCVFVSEKGCTVYPGRPGACRAYPMGRAAMRRADNSMEDFFVLLKESHCHGFQEQEEQTTEKYSKGQGLDSYNTFNDQVAALLQHEEIRSGMRLTEQQAELFVLALYDLDQFRKLLDGGNLPQQDDYPAQKERCQDDEQLLIFGVKWLQKILF